jgi:hypothetical protein
MGGTCYIIYRAQTGECRRVDSEIVGDWKNNGLLQEIKEYDYVAYTRVPVVRGPVCFPTFFNCIIVISQILHFP